MAGVFPPALTEQERRIVEQFGERSKYYRFLLEVRAEQIDPRFRQVLMRAYSNVARGRTRVEPEVLALAMLMQAYAGASDAETVERAKYDLRWRLVLGAGLVPESSLFAQKTLVFFRRRLIAHGLDGALIARAARLSDETGLFAGSAIRAFQFVPGATPWERVARSRVAVTQIWRSVRKLVTVLARVRLQKPEAMLGLEWRGYACSSTKSPLAAVPEDDPDVQIRLFRRVVSEARTLRRWLRGSDIEGKQEAEVRQADRELKQLLKQFVRSADGEIVLSAKPDDEAPRTPRRSAPGQNSTA